VLYEIGKANQVLKEEDNAAFYYKMCVAERCKDNEKIQREAFSFLIKYYTGKKDDEEVSYYQKQLLE
jgi:hypothetical protein